MRHIPVEYPLRRGQKVTSQGRENPERDSPWLAMSGRRPLSWSRCGPVTHNLGSYPLLVKSFHVPNASLADVYWRAGCLVWLSSCAEGEAYGPRGVFAPRWPPAAPRDVAPGRGRRPADAVSHLDASPRPLPPL